jgi:hypothetical protein
MPAPGRTSNAVKKPESGCLGRRKRVKNNCGERRTPSRESCQAIDRFGDGSGAFHQQAIGPAQFAQTCTSRSGNKHFRREGGRSPGLSAGPTPLSFTQPTRRRPIRAVVVAASMGRRAPKFRLPLLVLEQPASSRQSKGSSVSNSRFRFLARKLMPDARSAATRSCKVVLTER